MPILTYPHYQNPELLRLAQVHFGLSEVSNFRGGERYTGRGCGEGEDGGEWGKGDRENGVWPDAFGLMFNFS